MRFARQRVSILAPITIGFGIAVATDCSAAESVPPAATTSSAQEIDEIIVTAQKRKESAQTIPAAISALGASSLSSINLSTATDITTHVPNLRFVELSPLSVNYNIRGVSQNDYADHLEPPIALYEDEAYLATVSQGSLPMFDIERVEVLRGPQGTLFGRNATGGAIRFITAEPSKTFEGFAQATVGEDNWHRFEGAVGGPLADTVQFRVAAVVHSRGGYLTDRATFPSDASAGGVQAPVGEALGGENYVATRAALAWQPSDTVAVSLQARYWNNLKDGSTGGAYVYAATAPGPHGLGEFVGPDSDPYGTGPGCGVALTNCYHQPGLRNGAENTSGYFTRQAVGSTLKVDWDLGEATLTSVTDGQHMNKSYFEDADGSPYALLTDYHTSELDQYSQELRLVKAAGVFRWTVGGQYLYFKTNNLTDYNIFDSALDSVNTTHVTTSSGAAFGQVEYEFIPTLTGILGTRFTHDYKTASYLIHDSAGRLFDLATAPRDLSHLTFNDVSGKAALQWQAARDLLLYGSYNRGIKSGGFEFSGFLPVDPDTIPYKKEVLNDYEVGEKWTFWNGAARVNTALFYYDYRNYQAYVFLPVTGGGFAQTIRNLNATSEGAEIELAFKPVTDLTVSIGASWLDTRVKNVQLPDGTLAERALPQSPRFSGNVSVRYERPITTSVAGAIQFDVNYVGAQSFTVLAAPDELERAYSTGALRVSAKKGPWEVAFFVDNIWNETYRQFALDLSSLGTIAQVYARPRTAGASLRFDL